MPSWLTAALDHLPRWAEHQLRIGEQPGVSYAVAHRGRVVQACAFGVADLATGTALTERHRFRVASHSKTFTATAVLKLREQGRLQLDQPIGGVLPGLHQQVAAATWAQLLSHTAGLPRDGADASQWADRRPFLDAAALLKDLADGPAIDPNTRFKYSNHGYGLVGLGIEALTGEAYADWVMREVVAPSGLADTVPDAAFAPPRGRGAARLASGHSSRLPLGRRVVVPGDNPTRALAPATGFVSTPSDLARFYASLDPQAARSVLSVESRREMVRRQWRDPHAGVERWYGLGTISGTVAGWEVFGHSGAFQGTLSRSVCVPAEALSLSIAANSVDAPVQAWADAMLHLLATACRRGAPTRRNAGWSGRWWSLWGCIDLLPVGDDTVLVANPALANPVADATEIVVEGGRRQGVSRGRIALAGGYGSHGEPVRLEHDARGRAQAFWFGGYRYASEATVARELVRRYEPPDGEH